MYVDESFVLGTDQHARLRVGLQSLFPACLAG